MLVLALRRLSTPLALLALAALTGCADDVGSPSPSGELEAYLDSPSFRYDQLEASLVAPENQYSRLRLERYEAWSSLPEYNPAARPFTVDDLGRFVETPRATSAQPLAPLDLDAELTLEGLAELGRVAFETYPVDLDPGIVEGTVDADTAESLGLWIDDRGRVGGLLRVTTADGAETTGITCATCHATTDERGRLIPGLANAAFHRSGISEVGRRRRGEPSSDRGWPPGQLDVTPDNTDNPVAIGDLRVVRRQTHLHWAATVRNGLIPLALRIETLIITSHEQALRPPRIVPLAIAAYLWTLPDPPPQFDEADRRGAELFDAHCARCHGTGRDPLPPVPLNEVGTDTAAGLTSSRATGTWRVPTLAGVGTRRQLLHTGTVHDLDELFRPERLESTPGHAFGTDLSDTDRDALVRWLRTR